MKTASTVVICLPRILLLSSRTTAMTVSCSLKHMLESCELQAFEWSWLCTVGDTHMRRTACCFCYWSISVLGYVAFIMMQVRFTSAFQCGPVSRVWWFIPHTWPPMGNMPLNSEARKESHRSGSRLRWVAQGVNKHGEVNGNPSNTDRLCTWRMSLHKFQGSEPVILMNRVYLTVERNSGLNTGSVCCCYRNMRNEYGEYCCWCRSNQDDFEKSHFRFLNQHKALKAL